MQVKAESNAKKAEKMKATSGASAKRSSAKATPVASPSVDSKPIAAAVATKKTTTAAIKKTSVTETDKINVETSKQVEQVTTEAKIESSSVESTTEVVAIVENGSSSEGTAVETVDTTQETIVQELTVASTVPATTVVETVVTTSEVITENVPVDSGEAGLVTTETVTTSKMSGDDQATTVTSTTITEEITKLGPQQQQQIEASDLTAENSVMTNNTNTAAQTNGLSSAKDTSVTRETNNNNEDSDSRPATETAEAVNGTASASDKPVTGYATEEEYKAVLAEKRRLAREAREKEIEMERQKEVGSNNYNISKNFLLSEYEIYKIIIDRKRHVSIYSNNNNNNLFKRFVIS